MDLQFGQYRLSRTKRLVLGPDGPTELSSRSFDILAILLEKPDRVVSKSEIFDAVWPNVVVEENTLQVHISALRKSLPSGMIVTVHGRGYKYAGPHPTPGKASPGAGSAADEMPAGQYASSRSRPTIAVLPFSNMGGNEEQNYFSAGITDDLIVELSRYRPLNVVAGYSSSLFKDAKVDVKEAGKALGAQYLVEGSVRKIGNSIRVSAQLLDATNGSHLWADRYDREFQNVFFMQDDLVRRLVSAITGQVERHTDSRAQTKGTESLDAYDLWVRANQGSDLWTVEGNQECQSLLERCIEKDQLFARAHASLAFCHIRTAHMSPGSDTVSVHEHAALQCAEQAVRLDAAEARAHSAAGWSHMYLREFERARSRFNTAASLNPNDGSACIDRALALAFLGDQSAADEAAETAVTLNPLGGEYFYSIQGIVHCMGRRYDAAEHCLALGPRTLPDALGWRAANLSHLGRQDEAAELTREALRQFKLLWCGSAPATFESFIDWFHHVSMFRRREDWDHIRRHMAEPTSE